MSEQQSRPHAPAFGSNRTVSTRCKEEDHLALPVATTVGRPTETTGDMALLEGCGEGLGGEVRDRCWLSQREICKKSPYRPSSFWSLGARRLSPFAEREVMAVLLLVCIEPDTCLLFIFLGVFCVFGISQASKRGKCVSSAMERVDGCSRFSLTTHHPHQASATIDTLLGT